MSEPIRLTQYSHGAGCGCKISPKVLDVILAESGTQALDPKLWVGNASRDDAAVYALDDERGVVSTTDFFMPIVDDPYDFGRIAATNAISDIYAMGGDPLMAIAILGWPVNVLPPEVAREVIRGGRAVCAEAGIPLAGGHSIDAPEPIFGLAVTGVVSKRHLKRNDTATAGCQLYLTKPLGIGILTTAEKKAKLREQDQGLARDWMCTLNTPGSRFGKLDGVMAMTPSSLPKRLPGVLRVHIQSRARPWSCSRSLAFFSAVVRMPMPSGLVRYSWQPAVAVSLRLRWRLLTTPVTARPKIGSGASMEWPPASGMPASAHTARPPRITSRATSGGSTLTGQPRMAMAISGSPPMA